MKKRTLSFLTGIALAAGCTAMPAAAETAMPDSAALLKQIRYGSYEQYTPIPADAGIMTADGPAAVTCTKSYAYAGIAFTCADAAALIAAAPASYPILKSEGQYLDDSIEANNSANAKAFLMQPLTGYAEAFADRWGDILPSGNDGNMLADFADAKGTVYLIASHPDAAEELVTWLYQQPDVQILGAAYGTSEANGWYDNIPPVVYAAPAEGYTLTQADFGEYGANAVPQPDSPFGYWMLALPVGLTYDEAQAICDTLSENPAIASVAHAGYQFTASDGSALESMDVELVSFSHKGTGDLTGDGEVNIADAVIMARFNAEDTELDISGLHLNEADLNEDGLTDALDLSALLRLLASQPE